MKNRGGAFFTLIELLVVVAVLLILVAFLLPVITKARERARYARWSEHSHTMRMNERLLAYYHVETVEGDRLQNWSSGIELEPYHQELYDGAINGATYTETDGRWTGKSALTFDGSDDYVRIGQPYLPTDGGLTLEAWVNLDATTDGTIIGKTQSSGFALEYRSQQFRYRIHNGSYNNVTSDVITDTDDWYHVVGTWDGERQILYVNGDMVDDRATVADQLTPNTVDLLLGANPGSGTGTSTLFTGVIDEAAIFGRALSATEVRTHYRSGEP